jgi:hypothetical protein
MVVLAVLVMVLLEPKQSLVVLEVLREQAILLLLGIQGRQQLVVTLLLMGLILVLAMVVLVSLVALGVAALRLVAERLR